MGAVGIGAIAVVAIGAFALPIGSQPNRLVSTSTPPGAVETTGCRVPTTSGPSASSSSAEPATRIQVPGATDIDTGGLLPGPVVEASDGSTWMLAGRPNAPAVTGRVARIDPAGANVTQIVSVVDGCDASALAHAGDTIWVGTCDSQASTGAVGGAELVGIDTTEGRVTRRVPLATTCVAAIASDGRQVWATSSPRIGEAQRLWRIDASGALHDLAMLAAGESISSMAVATDAMWSARTSPAETRLVRSDPVTDTELMSIPVERVRVLGIVDGLLWTLEPTISSVVARDAGTGVARSTVAVRDVRAAALATDGVWVERAGASSLTVTIGRLAPGAGEAQAVASFEGPGPDRTGVPFLGMLSTTPRGAWLSLLDRLFFFPGDAAAAPRTTAPPSETTRDLGGPPAETTGPTVSTTPGGGASP